MKKEDIPKFIDHMADYGDEWNEEQVERVYGKKTLQEAIDHRVPLVTMNNRNIAIAHLYHQ